MRGTAGHKYLVKWKGYGPFHTSWEPACDVKADRFVQRYEAELVKKRQYLDGVVEINPDERDGAGTRLDAEAYNQNDSETLGLLCPVTPAVLLWVAAIWNAQSSPRPASAGSNGSGAQPITFVPGYDMRR